MAPDMQARRDAFLMLTDERPPEQPKRWLVVWTEDDRAGTKWTEWAQYDFGMDAEHARKQIARRGIDAQIHDLDAQA